MKVAIQCAANKQPYAGSLLDRSGTPVVFVAHPEKCDRSGSRVLHCRPDDQAGPVLGTWREILVDYNRAFVETGANPDKLLAAGDLYTPPAYRELVSCLGVENVFIASAGWGIIRADYLLSNYNITFSKAQNVPPECRRGRNEPGWSDFNQLRGSLADGEELHFFGGREYLDLFYSLTQSSSARGKFVIHHKAALRPRMGYLYEKYLGSASTNWHYLAARDLASSLRQ